MKYNIGNKHKLNFGAVGVEWYTNGVETIAPHELKSRECEGFIKKTMTYLQEASGMAKILCKKHNIESITFVYTEVTKEGTTLPENCWDLAILEGRQLNSPDTIRYYAEVIFDKNGSKISDITYL